MGGGVWSGPSLDPERLAQIHTYYGALWRAGIAVDFVSPAFDISKQKVFIAPLVCLLQPGFAEKAEKCVPMPI